MALPITFTVRESAGIARTANDPLWFPVCIPFAQSDAVTSTTGLAVRDLVQNALVPAQIIPHTRYGNYGDTSKALASALVYFRPTLTAGERRAFRVEVGTNPTATEVVTVVRSASVATVNTGATNGAIFEIPLTGAQSIIRKCTLPGALVVINSDNGGLVAQGVATNRQGVVESQNQEYASRNDTSGDGTANGATASERYLQATVPANGPRVTKWAVETLLSGPEVAVLKISCARMKTAGGVAFKGKGRIRTPNSPSDPILSWDVTCDTYLWFFAGNAAFVVDVVNKSTGNRVANQVTTSDVSCDLFGVDFAPTWSGSGTKITVCDEAAATKATQAAVTASVIARQRSAPGQFDGLYHFSVTYSGITAAGANTAWNHALIDSTKSDNSMGLAVFPWNWLNYYPQGVTWDLTSGKVRWECLNPDDPDVQQWDVDAGVADQWAYHGIHGPKQPRWTAWVLPHAGLLTTTQLVAAAQRYAGVCEAVDNGTYHAMTPGGKGGQIPSMLGSVDSEVWHASKAFWDSLVPRDLVAKKTAMRTRAPRSTSFDSALALPAVSSSAIAYGSGSPQYPAFVGNTTRGEDALDVLDRWRQVRIDGTRAKARGTSGSDDDDLYWQTIVMNDGVPMRGWRDYGSVGTSGSACGANDYDANMQLGQSWLLTEERAYWHHFYTSVRHHMAIDLEHGAISDDQQLVSNGMNWDWASGRRHCSGGGPNAAEYQQFNNDLPLLFLLTGDYVARESMEWVIESTGRRFAAEHEALGFREPCMFDRSFHTGTFSTGSPGLVTNLSGDLTKLVPGQRSLWILEPNGGATSQLLSVDVAGRSAQFSAPFPNFNGPGRLWGAVLSSSRSYAWPMQAMVYIMRVLGPNVTTNYNTGQAAPPGLPARVSLATWITCMSEKIVHSEQMFASDAVKAGPVGGVGVLRSTTDGNQLTGNLQNETYSAYAMRPMRDAYIAMKWLRANGWASEVPQASIDQNLAFLERGVKLCLTGVDGLDWSAYWTDINTSPWSRKIPWITGGKVTSDSAAIVHFSFTNQMYLWNTGQYYFNSVNDLSALFPVNTSHKYQNGNFQGASQIIPAEVAAWLALEKYHAAADTARRDHALNLALLACVSASLWSGTTTYGFIFSGRGIPGEPTTDPYMFHNSDPHFTYWVTPFLSPSGPLSVIRNKNWLGAAGEYSLRLLVDGFPDSTPTSAALVAAVTGSADVAALGLQDAATAALLVAALTGVADTAATELLSTPADLGQRQVAGPRDVIPSPRPLRPKDTSLSAAIFSTAGLGAFVTTDVDVAAATSGTATVSGSLQAGQLSETFTGTNSDPGTLTGDGTWTQVLGAAWKNLSNMAVVENGPVYTTVLARRSNDLPSSDFDISALVGDWTALTATDMWLGVGVFNASATTGYGAHIAKDAGSAVCRVSPWKCTAGDFASLATPVVVAAPTTVSSVLRVRRIAGTGVLTVFYEGAQVAEVTNSDIAVATTRPVIWAGMGPRSGTVRVGWDSLNADVAA